MRETVVLEVITHIGEPPNDRYTYTKSGYNNNYSILVEYHVREKYFKKKDRGIKLHRNELKKKDYKFQYPFFHQHQTYTA